MGGDLNPEDAATRPALLVRAAMPWFHRGPAPTYQYLGSTGDMWVTFDEAVRFPPDIPTTDLPAHLPAAHPDAVISWVPDLARDLTTGGPTTRTTAPTPHG